MKTFSDGEALKFGWQTMKKNFKFFFLVVLVVLLFSSFPQVLDKLMAPKKSILLSVIYLVFWVMQTVITMGVVKIALKFTNNEKPKFGDLFSCFPFFLKYLAGAVLYAVIVLGGLILLVAPGFVWGVKYQFFIYAIVDKKMGPVAALKESGRITSGAKWDLFGFGILCLLINLSGILLLVVGLFAAMPAVMTAYAFVYRKLLQQSEAV